MDNIYAYAWIGNDCELYVTEKQLILVNTIMRNGYYLKEPLVVEAVDDTCSVESVTSDSSSEELNRLAISYNLQATRLYLYTFSI